MAQTVASMAGSTQAVSRIDRRLHGGPAPACRTRRLAVRAQQADGDAAPSSRRAMLGLVAVGIGAGSFVQGVLAEAKPIKIGPPPPPSGGLPGTLNSDEPRDLDLAYKNRFYIQPLPADLAAQRAKDAAKDILGVKSLIAKKQWPYVQMDLRNKASYLRYDLETVIAAKPKEEKKSLKALTKDLFSKIENLDYAAKIKSQTVAEKSYAEAASALESVIAKLG